MKKTVNILLALIALTSCEKWLDKYPQSSLTETEFFRTEADLQAFSNKWYTMFPGESLYEEAVDNYALQSLPDELNGSRVVPSSGGGWSWGTLRDVNTLLEENVCEDPEIKARYNALAHFFRAWFYFEKVIRFGDVPWFDHQLGSASDDLYRPRDSREFVMQHILEDLDDAIAHLSTKKDVYRVTKWTALALKSRVCLFEGTFRKYHDISYPEHTWQWYLEQGAAAAKEFIETSGYGLRTADGKGLSYLTLFAEDNADPTEVILARDYSAAVGVKHNGTFYTLGNYGNPGMTRKIVASYLCSDGSRFTDKAGWETMTFSQETKNRDPRLSQSIRTPGYTRFGSTKKEAPSFSCCVTGYQSIKYVQSVSAGVDGYGLSYNDLIIMRSAEVYLNYAEALAELGTLKQSDIDMSIKKLRDRVGMPNISLQASNDNPDPFLSAPETGYPGVSGANKGVILEIRRERTIELAKEGFRYWDMMRWKEGQAFTQEFKGMYFPGEGDYDLDGDGTLDVTLYSGDKPSTGATLKLKLGEDIVLDDGTSGCVLPLKGKKGKWDEERDYYYPIPSNDISLSKGTLKQNPKW